MCRMTATQDEVPPLLYPCSSPCPGRLGPGPLRSPAAWAPSTEPHLLPRPPPPPLPSAPTPHPPHPPPPAPDTHPYVFPWPPAQAASQHPSPSPELLPNSCLALKYLWAFISRGQDCRILEAYSSLCPSRPEPRTVPGLWLLHPHSGAPSAHLP